MHVLVILESVPKNGDLRIIMVARTEGEVVSMISPVVTLKGAAVCSNGNPYLLHGNACAEFVGKSKHTLSITVAKCTSGNLNGW